jgi:hypothetical protein
MIDLGVAKRKDNVMKSFLLSLLAVMTIAAFVSATIIHVPGQRQTIQRGIDAASDGDTVLVQPGTYVENINFNGHNILLCSMFKPTGDTSYIAQTIIDGDSSGTVVTIENGEDSNAVLCGFTITNGLNTHGGGISIKNYSNPIITDNIIIENLAYYGGGIYCDSAGATIRNNNIEFNQVTDEGAGIYCRNSTVTIDNNYIFRNSDILGYSCGGSGILCVESNSIIINNTIVDNNSFA